MNINALRWKGRIGGLKSVSMILLLFLVFIACASAISLNTALRNPDGPQPVTIEALVNDEVGTGRHVSVTGLAVYDIGYEQTEDGKTTSTYYFVVDVETGNMVLVKHSSALLVAKKNGVATITGMTRSMPTDLKDAVKEDGPLITKNGLRTTTKLYVADGAVPPSTGANAVFFVVSVIVGAVCCIPFFFPSKVFAPLPLDITATRAEGRPAVKATGTFVQIKSIDPLDIGKRTQKFTNAVANVIPRGEHDLMIYIHHVMTTKTYGITVRKTKTDWGLFLNAGNVIDVAAGKILGWKDKWAVQFHYTGAKEKLESLFLILENAGDQVEVVELLRQMRFDVVTGDMA